MSDRDEIARDARLGRAWDAWVLGRAPDSDAVVEPTLVSTISYLREHDDASAPDPDFVRNLRARFATPGADLLAEHLTTHAGAIEPPPPIVVPMSGTGRPETIRPWWAWFEVAAALLLVLVVAGLLVGSDRIAEFLKEETDSDQPSLIATPAAPDPTTPSPVVSAGVVSDVPMFRGNAAHTGAMTGPGPAEAPVERWRFAAPPAEERPTYERHPSPIVVGGVVYLADRSGYLYALDLATGQMRWRFRTGGLAGVTPAVAGELVFVGSTDGNLYAVDVVTGTEVWHRQVAPFYSSLTTADGVVYAAGGDPGSPPAIVDGVAYAGDGFASVVAALDARTGLKLWQTVVGVGEPSGWGVYAIDIATGKRLWRFTADESVQSAPAVAGGVVFVVDAGSTLYALDAGTGDEHWRLVLADDAGVSPMAIETPHSSPAVVDGVVYAASANGVLAAVDVTSGSVQWRVALTEAISSSPAVAGGVVYIGGLDGVLYALDAATGEVSWRFAAGAPIGSSPVVTGKDLLFGTGDGVLYDLMGTG
jgi:outer membrane protein assembly factor BamB